MFVVNLTDERDGLLHLNTGTLVRNRALVGIKVELVAQVRHCLPPIEIEGGPPRKKLSF